MAETPENPQIPDGPEAPDESVRPLPDEVVPPAAGGTVNPVPVPEPLPPPIPPPAVPATPLSPAELAGRSGSPVPGTAYPGDSPRGSSPPPKRTSAEIRADMEVQRNELGKSVDHLRDRVTELTDWRGQIRKHRKQIVIGAVATGFIVGGLMALRRR